MLSTFQEIKANDALAALKKLSSPSALVRRNGLVKEVPVEEVVLGDVVILEAGHYIPADVKLITSHTLRVDESLLTGESLAAQKDAQVEFLDFNLPFVDRKDLVFMSTLVSYGRGVGVVLATGMDTELGKIAKSLDSSERIKTPLELKMESLAKTL